GRLDAGVGVLEHDAIRRSDPQNFRNLKINLGMWLGVDDLAAIDDGLEVWPDAGLVEDEPDVLGFGVAGDRHGGVLVLFQEMAQAGNEHAVEPAMREFAIERLFGRPASGDFVLRESRPEEITDDVVIPLSIHAGVHGLGSLQPIAAVELLPRLAVERIG